MRVAAAIVRVRVIGTRMRRKSMSVAVSILFPLVLRTMAI